MRNRLELALMATSAIATLLSFAPCPEAASDAPVTATTSENRREIYVNHASVARSRPRDEARCTLAENFRAQASGLVDRSISEHRRRPLPHPKVRGARSAAVEVDQSLEQPVGLQNSSPPGGFSEKEIDEAIDKASSHQYVNAHLVRALFKVESNSIPMWFRGRQRWDGCSSRRKPRGRRSFRALSTYGSEVRLSPAGV